MSNQYGAAEEFDFFERVKKTLGNKTTYTEFLKVLNLFNQDIIDPKILVDRVQPFLSRSPDLFEWFKAYVHVDDSDEPKGMRQASLLVELIYPFRNLQVRPTSTRSFWCQTFGFELSLASQRGGIFDEFVCFQLTVIVHPTTEHGPGCSLL